MPIRTALVSIYSSSDFQTSEYTLKCYASSMLAYYIALRIGLQNPIWALITCYMTAAPQPSAGAVVSKALYRVIGTLLGVAASVVLVPLLVDSPLILGLALSAWLGLCTYIAVLDRTPRSYLFVLGGYTASIIGFPSVDSPAGIFNTAIVREQEIVIGIITAALIHGTLFPRTLTERVRVRIEQILVEAEGWSSKSLEGRRNPALDLQRRSLAIKMNELLGFAIQLPFDTARSVPNVNIVNALQDHLTLLLPIASAIEDRLAGLLADPAQPPSALTLLTAKVANWLVTDVRSGDYYTAAEELIAEADRARLAPLDGETWRRMLTLSALARLAELIRAHRDARALRDALHGTSLSINTPIVEALLADTRKRSLHRDHLSAAWTGFSAALTLYLGCLFWIATAWPAGAAAVLISGVGAALFGSTPGAPQIIRRFVAGVLLGIAIATFYGYVLLPRVTDSVLLFVVLAPALLLFGAVLARPAVGLLGLALVIGFLNTVGLASAYQHDFSTFANSALALVIGAEFTALIFSLTQIGTAKAIAIRLLRTSYRDVALQASRDGVDLTGWTSRMLDRIGQWPSVQILEGRGDRAFKPDLLIDLRTGILSSTLRRLRTSTPISITSRIDAILDAISIYYGTLNPRDPMPPPTLLLQCIDNGVRLFELDGDPESTRRGLTTLAGLRRNLFPDAPPYVSSVD
jgi:uncharacterized membrane protein YccC